MGIAFSEGTDGVFLIKHGFFPGSKEEGGLFEIYERTRELFPKYFIGINCLDLPAHEAIASLPASVDACWTDNGGIIERNNIINTIGAELILATRKKRPDWKGLLFGGIAFKYAREKTIHVGEVAKIARPYMDVITTSGDATGVPPSVEKIQTIRNAVGEDPDIAIASGMSRK